MSVRTNRADRKLWRIEPVNQITPFTYRDGATYLQVLNALRDYVTGNVVPEFHYELNRIIGDFQAGLSEAERNVEVTKDEFQTIREAFFEDVDAALAGLNDENVAGLAADHESQFGAALRDIFPTLVDLNTLSDSIQNRMAEKTDSTVYRVPEDYPNLQAAFNSLGATNTFNNSRITILISGGHRLAEGLSLTGGDYSHFRITSESNVVYLAESFRPVDSSAVSESNRAVLFFEECAAPVLDTLIDGRGNRGTDGLIAHSGARVTVKPGGGVMGTRMNLEVRDGTISAKNTRWSDASRGCIRLTDNTRFSISGSEAHDGWRNPPAGHSTVAASLHISRSSFGQAQSMRIDRSGFRAVTVRRSHVFLDGSEFGETALSGGHSGRVIRPMEGATVILGDSTFNGVPVTAEHCSVPAFNVPTFEGTVYSQNGPSLLETSNSGGRTETTISDRLVVSQRIITDFNLDNPNETLLGVGSETEVVGAYINVHGTSWMAGTGFPSRLRAVNSLVVGIDTNGTVRIRMADPDQATQDTVDLMLTVIGKPVE